MSFEMVKKILEKLQLRTANKRSFFMLKYILFVGEILVLLLFFFFYIRLIGRKELREASPIDFAYMVLLVNVGWDMLLESQYNLIHIFFALFILTVFYMLIDWLTFRYKILEKIFIGKPMTIIENGVMNKELLKKERISDEELKAMLRQNGAFDVSEIETAILEVDGAVSVKIKGDSL